MLSPWTLVLIAVGLAMDAVAVAISVSIVQHPVTRRQVFRLGFHLGLFQALMPILGWLSGHSVSALIVTWDHWIAFVLLVFIGAKAIHGTSGDAGARAPRTDPTRGLSLVLLSVATSIDAFAVGLSFAFLRVAVWYPAAVIGLITAALAVAAMLVGSRLGKHFGQRVEVLGGLVLIGIGFKILLQHVLSATE